MYLIHVRCDGYERPCNNSYYAEEDTLPQGPPIPSDWTAFSVDGVWDKVYCPECSRRCGEVGAAIVAERERLLDNRVTNP